MYCKVCKKDQETMKSNTVCLSCAEHRAAYYLKTSAKRIANAKQYKNSERGKELAILSRIRPFHEGMPFNYLIRLGKLTPASG